MWTGSKSDGGRRGQGETKEGRRKGGSRRASLFLW